MKYLILFCFQFFVLFYGSPVQSQDIHFSQFISSPLNLNPAQAGHFDGALRFAGNARRQWNSVTIPYQTYGGSVDAKNPFRIKNAGVGLSVYNDRTGDSRLNTLQANVALSYSIRLTRDSSQFITLGAQSGVTQRTISYEGLRYDNQYNGNVFDPNIGSIENFSNSGRLYPNVNAGIQWTRRRDHRNTITTGLSLYNINKPEQSFFKDQSIKLDRRLNLHFSSQHKLSEKVDLLPALLFMFQGTYQEYTLGSSIKYILNPGEGHYRALYFGLWTRAVDAGLVSAGMDYNNLYVGLSYDINYSKLTPASRARGGVELSVIYIVRHLLPKRKTYKICPNFI
jgi:type IX secretion system PorP/SprF family membrane protein